MKRNIDNIRSRVVLLSINTALPESPAAIRRGCRSSVTPSGRHTQRVTIAERISRKVASRGGCLLNGSSSVWGVGYIINSKILHE